MLSDDSKRPLILGGVALLLAALLAARWISGWGLVTVHARDVTLGKVLTSIARQAHVRIESSVDPARKVSLDVDQVPLAEALDVLAQSAGASWRSAAVLASTQTAITEALLSLRENPKPEGWEIRYYPSPPMSQEGDIAIDPLTLEWNPEGPGLKVASLLDEASQKSGLMTVFPKDWEVAAPNLPRTARTDKAIRELARSSRAKETFFYYLTDRPGGGGWGGRPKETFNPEWMDQRQSARIAKLPEDRRAEAKKDLEEWKARREEMKNLPPEERREKMRQMMSNPHAAEKIADRILVRDSTLTAQQRINRALGYLQQKAAAKAPGIAPGTTASPPAK